MAPSPHQRHGRSECERTSAGKELSLGVPGWGPPDLGFPFKDTVRPDESGQGYALRMAEENTLPGLPPLKTLLGKSRFAVLDSVDAPLLNRWFGAPQRLLEFALGRTSVGQADKGYVYAGQSLGRSYFLNRTYPRVCPECLKDSGYCRLTWDISLVVACSKHRRLLLDRCDYCQRALSWNRPWQGICNCGTALAIAEPGQAPTTLEIQFAAWADGRIGRGNDDVASVLPMLASPLVRPDALTALMTLLWPLSLNGGLHIAYALGTAASYDEQRQEAPPRPRTSQTKAQQVLYIANALAEKVIRLESVQFKSNGLGVVVQLLAESAGAQASPADRSLAQSILASVLNRKTRSKVSGLKPHLAQLPLF